MNAPRNSELFEKIPRFLQPLFTKYPNSWQIIPVIKNYIREFINSPPDGYSLFSEEIVIGRGVKIHESATLVGPCLIGDNTEIRPGAYIRGSVIISEGCVIGNSTEIKNSILLEGVQAPHYNYIGDSLLGSFSHLGAGAICSNLKADKSNVTIHSDDIIDTGLRKLGAILGDRVEIGCSCVLNPGTVVGKNTSVYPMISLRGIYPADSIVKSATEVVKRR